MSPQRPASLSPGYRMIAGGKVSRLSPKPSEGKWRIVPSSQTAKVPPGEHLVSLKGKANSEPILHHHATLEPSDYGFPRVPTGYSLAQWTDTNSTMSAIPGPGRLVGSLLASAGLKVEKIIDRLAERMGLGPNMAALQLTREIHALHAEATKVAGDGPSIVVGCTKEDSKGVGVSDIALRLLWACNGICSQCRRPYIPSLIDEGNDALRKALSQLAASINVSSAPSNVELGCVYLQILAESRVLSRAMLERAGIINTLADSIDFYIRSGWEAGETTSFDSALTMMRRIKRSIGAMDSRDPGLRFDMAMANESNPRPLLPPVGELILLANSRESLDWICLIAVVQMCSWVIHMAPNYPLGENHSFSETLLACIKSSMNWVDMPEECREHARMAHDCIAPGRHDTSLL